MIRHRLKWLFFTSVFVTIPLSATAENQVQTKLISNVETAQPGAKIYLGILFDIPKRSHIYWRNPGDSGLPTSVDWQTDPAVSIGDVQWPVPKQFSIEGLEEAYFGYTDEVLLFSEFTLPEDAKPDSSFLFKVSARWLLCLDDGVCIPEDREMETLIHIQNSSRYTAESALFSNYSKLVPKETDWSNVIYWDRKAASLDVAFPKNWSLPQKNPGPVPIFYPDRGGAWSMQTFGSGAPGIKLRFKPVYKGDQLCGGVLALPIKEQNRTRLLIIKVAPPEIP